MNRHPARLPTRLEADGVCIQSQDWSELNVARIRLRKGTDVAPLLVGLPGNLCQCPHWGAVLRGSIRIRYVDGREEVARAGEVYYWPAGHTIRAEEDFEAIAFSPSAAMSRLIDHLRPQLAGDSARFEINPKEASP
jgi:hypothetical protein